MNTYTSYSYTQKIEVYKTTYRGDQNRAEAEDRYEEEAYNL